jgi:hypothetical protein
MTSSRAIDPSPRVRAWLGPLLLVAAACNAANTDDPDTGMPMALPGTGGVPATGGTTAPSMAGSGGKAGNPGMTVMDAGKTTGSGGAAPVDAGTTKPPDAGHPDASAPDASAPDSKTFAGDLDALFIDAPCDSATPSPPPNMATCQHPPQTQHIEKAVTFGGDASATYEVVLRVRGIWEPTSITGGQRPDADLPLTLGGTVAVGTGDPINYQQYSIVVSKPAQTYWLNDYRYVAHDIHKEDYMASIEVAGGAEVKVIMNDGNDHQIANWTEDYFQGLAPYATEPSTGQMLRLDVVSVIEK